MALTYHVGLNLDAPFDVIHLGGVEFPKWTETVEGYGVETKRSKVQGAYLELEEEQLQRIAAAATRKVFRYAGKPRGKKGYRRAILVDKAGTGFQADGTPSKAYKPQADDVDVARFVYVRESAHNFSRGETFETLSQASPAKVEPEPPSGKKKAS